ncbi:dynein light chain Tctex-type 5-like [Lytechinus pictus]|uniref:dynein light chain Tctex-type 5-like n=1 Tax=Lytechinus pictus TaxID=7653 RepID=UPI00240E4690|nr:dynein light chain Tctex-type 5-like [Lytechinus pictus]XP_054764446.1 dynein light chain Tctex-type 5-like [Lytechinus pictus]
MAALSERNLEQFNQQQPTGRRRPSVMSRRASIVSSHSTSKEGDMMGPPGYQGKFRRLSRAYSISMGSHRGNHALRSAADSQHSKPAAVKYENTFKMKPDEGAVFKHAAVQSILETVLERYLSTAQYAPKTVSMFTQNIVDEVKRRVKDLKMPRYKIVCQVYIGSKNGQSMQMVSRAVWNTETDNFATANYQNQSLYAIASVHATYFE